MKNYYFIMGEAGSEIHIPRPIAESSESAVWPNAKGSAYDAAKELVKIYIPESRDGEEIPDYFSQEGKKVIDKLLTPSSRLEPEEAWQAQWLTVFMVFYQLGMSKLKGEGNGSGNEDLRFAAKTLQTHLIDTSENKKVKIAGLSDASIQNQTNLLKGTARFALAAAEADYDIDWIPRRYIWNEQHPWDAFMRAFWRKDELLKMLRADLVKSPDNRRFRIDEI